MKTSAEPWTPTGVPFSAKRRFICAYNCEYAHGDVPITLRRQVYAYKRTAYDSRVPNELVIARLEAIRGILTAAFGGGRGMVSTAVGSEREAFVNLVLCNAIGPPFRVGTGEITDPEGHSTGQVDVVIEYASSLSFPLLQGDSSRLYLTEGICAVVEVKSDVSRSWEVAVDKARAVHRLSHNVGHAFRSTFWPKIPEHIQFFIVGYKAWSDKAEIGRRIAKQRGGDAPIDGALLIDDGIYVGAGEFEPHSLTGALSLYGFLLSIEHLTSSMIAAKPAYSAYIA